MMTSPDQQLSGALHCLPRNRRLSSMAANKVFIPDPSSPLCLSGHHGPCTLTAGLLPNLLFPKHTRSFHTLTPLLLLFLSPGVPFLSVSCRHSYHLSKPNSNAIFTRETTLNTRVGLSILFLCYSLRHCIYFLGAFPF